MMGKIIGNDVYISIVSVDKLNSFHKHIFERYFHDLSEDVKLKINVIRVNSYDKDISFLEYENLSEEAFPKLFTSIRAGNDFPYPRKTDYSCSNNPPSSTAKNSFSPLITPTFPNSPRLPSNSKMPDFSKTPAKSAIKNNGKNASAMQVTKSSITNWLNSTEVK
ncbi:hypothetical protein HMY34_08740 [Thiothrix subterranea]|uniref:hypothetical protein n=1 Tax=Thiothrix subterranea TaxID=2735563 RepID=UPI00192B7C03|nr:hypothetical protein [Thiothrix subterranea]QQZ28830.1 hypothetical protein HMY34_08740 [Thiothrix subterranea]